MELPADLATGTYSVVVVMDNQPASAGQKQAWKMPVIDVGPWPANLSLRREDMYGDNGR